MHSTFSVQNSPPKTTSNLPAIININNDELEVYTINPAFLETIKSAGTSDEDSTYLDTSQKFIIEGSYIATPDQYASMSPDSPESEPTPPLQSMDDLSQKKLCIGVGATKMASGPNSREATATTLGDSDPFASETGSLTQTSKQVKKPGILKAQMKNSSFPTISGEPSTTSSGSQKSNEGTKNQTSEQSSYCSKQVKKPGILKAQMKNSSFPTISGEPSTSSSGSQKSNEGTKHGTEILIPKKKNLRFSKYATVLGVLPYQTRIIFKSPDTNYADSVLNPSKSEEGDCDTTAPREKVKRKISNGDTPMTTKLTKNKAKPKLKHLCDPGSSVEVDESTAVQKPGHTQKACEENKKIGVEKRKITLNPKYFGTGYDSECKRKYSVVNKTRQCNPKLTVSINKTCLEKQVKAKLPKKRDAKPNMLYFGPDYVTEPESSDDELDQCNTKLATIKEKKCKENGKNELTERNPNPKCFRPESSDDEIDWGKIELPKRVSKPNPTYFGPQSPFEVERPAFQRVLSLQSKVALINDVIEGSLSKKEVAKKYGIPLCNLKDIVKSWQTTLDNFMG